MNTPQTDRSRGSPVGQSAGHCALECLRRERGGGRNLVISRLEEVAEWLKAAAFKSLFRRRRASPLFPETGKAPGNAGGDEEIRGRVVQAGAGADVELEIFVH